MIVSKTRNAPGWATQGDNLIPNGVKCNENVIWVSVLRLEWDQRPIKGRLLCKAPQMLKTYNFMDMKPWCNI